MVRSLRPGSEAQDIVDALGVDRSITVKDAALILGCDGGTVRQLLDAGELSGHRVGIKKRGVRIFLSSVQAYREQNTLAVRSEAPIPKKKAPSRQSSTPEYKEAIAFLKSIGIRFDPR